jgi:Hpt domain
MSPAGRNPVAFHLPFTGFSNGNLKQKSQDKPIRAAKAPCQDRNGSMPQLAIQDEIIAPSNDLRKKVRKIRTRSAKDDPVARAEAAIQVLSSNFDNWMGDSVEVINTALESWRLDGYASGEARDNFFRTVHDLKGQATTLGFPLACRVASSLCAILDGASTGASLPINIIRQHVSAIGAIHRERAKDESHRVGQVLATTLEEFTRKYLAVNGRSELTVEA